MIITVSNICHYLIDKGFVTRESVVDGDFMVVDMSGRNRNLKVVRKRRPSYFVKQIQHWDSQTIAMLQCEAACYWLARNDAGFSPLSPLLPEFFSYDLERHILITELIPESENLYEHFRRVGGFPPEVAATLGEALGGYHRAAAGIVLEDSPQRAIFPGQVPWILSADRRNSHPFKELSPATSQLFDVVEGSTQLRQALDELRAGWRARALMHGDMRWENCVLSRSGATGGPALKIVDWELADLGDVCWDAGAIIQAYLSVWAVSVPEAGSDMPDACRAGETGYSLELLQPSIQAFWGGYVDALGVSDAGERRSLLERCVRYAAARMIQSAYEYVQFSPQVSASALRMLEVSASILQNPSQAIRQLLGLERA